MNIDVVIVTFNRLEKLKHTLSCYENQTVGFRNLIVVDNHSNDGTIEYLSKWKEIETEKFDKHVLFLSENTGGSGGFYAGQKYAMDLNPDWIYLSDDDAYPNLDTIELFISIINNQACDSVSSISGCVKSIDGSIQIEHRNRIVYKNQLKFKKVYITTEEYESDYFEIDSFSYVCTFVNVKMLKKVGLCNPQFFIYYDDTEHSLRLSKVGKLLCYPSITAIHDSGATIQNSITSEHASWRDYYTIRNECYMLIHTKLYSAVYFILTQFAYSLKSHWKEPSCLLLKITALYDGLVGNLGIHKVYKPGFAIKK